ncbi:MAG: HAD family hydrolase [Hydrogenovibrio sp.]
MALAIFDLDHTLINGDSDYLWGKFLIDKGAVDKADYERQNERFYQDYQNGTLDIMAYQRFSLAPLSRYDMEALERWHSEFMETVIHPIYQPRAQALVDEHRAKGDTLLIITATNSFVTRPIGQLYGIDHLIGTDPEIVANRFTGEVAGEPSFQQGKVSRLHEWLICHHHTLDGSSFYSDSRNDIPLLDIVENPVAVDCDATLRAYATERRWPIISLKD